MSINSATGLISWTPAAGSESAVTVTVRVSDRYGSGSDQTFIINVAPAGENRAPVITSTPDRYYALMGETYSYQLAAHDLDPGTALTYGLESGPAGAAVSATGLFTWTPAPAPAPGSEADASATVAITVDDGLLGAAQTFTLLAVNNTPPVLGALADLAITAGQTLTFAIPATDPEGYALSYELLLPLPPGEGGGEGSSGATVDEFGRITWATTAADATTSGGVTFTFIATDVFGSSVQGSFTVTVNPDTQAPVFLIEQSAATIALGETATFVISVTDDVAVAPESLTITVNGEPVPVSPVYGGYTFTYTATVSGGAGETTITASATDAAGNVGTSEATLQVFDPTDPPPVLAFDSELEMVSGGEITAPRDILGLVDDPSDNLTNYRLSLVSEEGIERELSAGTTEVGSSASGTTGVLGQLDPTLLANGSYTLRLVAEDAAGNTSVAESIVHINGRLKLGNFNLSFTDLSLPLGGIPITISRTYDTLNADKLGDFGYGWNLDIANLSVRADVATLGAIPRNGVVGDNPLAGLEDAGILTPWRYGTRLNVRLPDGTLERYTVSLKALEGAHGAGNFVSGLLNIYTIDLIPDRSTSGRLGLSQQWQVLLNPDTGELKTPDGVPFNPASSLLDIDYTYTTRDGVQYALSGATGKLQTITDRNGNRLEIDSSGRGVRSINPTGVTIAEIPFTRDHLGRITAITDPSGNSIRYAYDPTGDLVSVTDRVDAVTQFIYDPETSGNRRHFLTDITDPHGVRVVHTVFDRTFDRIASLTTPLTTAALEFQVGIPISGQIVFITRVVTPAGASTTTVRDVQANPVRRIQLVDSDESRTTYRVVATSFDDQGNVVAASQPFLVHDSAATQDDDLDVFMAPPEAWNSYAVYDENNLVTTLVNSLGHTKHFTRGTHGELLGLTDPMGNTTSYVYNTVGQVTQVTVPNGALINYAYDTSGNVVSASDGTGTQRFHAEYATGSRPISVTEAGVTQYMVYDAVGNLTVAYSHSAATNSADVITVVRRTFYDDSSRVIGSASYMLPGSQGITTATELDYFSPSTQTATEYSSTGQVLSESDPFGHVKRYRYDSLSRLIEVREQVAGSDGTPQFRVSRTAYGPHGIVATSAVSYLEGVTSPEDLRVTQFDYDLLGRRVASRLLAGAAITVTEDPMNSGLWRSTFEPGSVTNILSETTTEYSIAGDVLASVADSGAATFYFRNSDGAIVRELIDVDGSIETLSDQMTTDYAYDQNGQQISTTNAIGATVLSAYDSMGRILSSDASGILEERAYDAVGHLIEETSGGRRMKYDYDMRGQLASVLIAGRLTDPSTDSIRYEYEYDSFGRLLEVRDPMNRSVRNTYDANSRLIERRLPLGQTEVWEYDDTPIGAIPNISLRRSAGGGQVSSHIDADRHVIRYWYDNSPEGGGKLVETQYFNSISAFQQDAAERIVERRYDAQGRLISHEDSTAGSWTYRYSPEGYVLEETSPEGTVTMEYSSTGRLLIVHAGAQRTEYEYDGLGRLIGLTNEWDSDEIFSMTTHTAYRFDSVGRIGDVDYGNGIRTLYTWNSSSTLAAVVHFQDLDDDGSYGSQDRKIARYEYSYDTFGRRIGATETDDLENTNLISWQYDYLGRLINESFDGVGGDGSAVEYVETYNYDPAGNLTDRYLSDTLNPDRSIEVFYAYDDNDRMLQETRVENAAPSAITYYDYGTANSGTAVTGIRRVIEGAESLRTFTYDSANRLVSATSSRDPDGSMHFVYGPSNQRIGERLVGSNAVTRQFLVSSYNPSGSPQVSRETSGADERYFEIGYRVFAVVNDQSRRILLEDAHGSTRVIINADGTVAERIVYSAFGRTLGNTQPLNSPLLYSGEWRVAEIEADYLRSRFYYPGVARFLQADTFAGLLYDPQTLNSYTYALNNPVSRVDPSGHLSLVETLVSVGIVSGLSVFSAGVFYRAGRDPIYGLYVGALAGGSVVAAYAQDMGTPGPTFMRTVFWGLGAGAITGATSYLVDHLYDQVSPRWETYAADFIEGFAWAAYDVALARQAYLGPAPSDAAHSLIVSLQQGVAASMSLGILVMGMDKGGAPKSELHILLRPILEDYFNNMTGIVIGAGLAIPLDWFFGVVPGFSKLSPKLKGKLVTLLSGAGGTGGTFVSVLDNARTRFVETSLGVMDKTVFYDHP